MDRFQDDIDFIARNCVGVRLRMLNRAISAIYDAHLRPLGIKGTQLNILVATAKMGIARPAAMCSALCMDTSTLSRNTERLRTNGWIEVVPDSTDARAQPFQLTAEGRRLLQKALPAWRKAQQEAESVLGPSGMEAIRKAARAIDR